MTHRLLPLVATLAALAAPIARPAPPAPPSATAPQATKAPAGSPAPAPAGGDVIYAHLTMEDGRPIKAPLFAPASEGLPVAKVGDDVITLHELSGALAGAHASMAAGAKAGAKDFTPVLDRLIDSRLVLLEAADMGLSDLPEVKQAAGDAKEKVATSLLQARILAGVKGDRAEADRLYQVAAREWKVKSVLFEKEEPAKALRSGVAAGKSFDGLAKQAVAAKQAKGGEAAPFVGRDQLLPGILNALEKLKPGAVSAPVKVTGGWTVMQVEAVRTAQDPKKRAEADAKALSRARQSALKRAFERMTKSYARKDEKLLKALDFEAPKPGFDALMKDRRVLARVERGAPVTVADVAEALDKKFYHGIEGAIRTKKLNAEKRRALESVLSRRLVAAEAERLGLAGSPEFQQAFAEQRNGILFGTFIQRVVAPDIKVSEEERKKYYDQHQAEFSYPAFYKLESLGFANVKDAQATLLKLRSGTDFKWLKANADGQLKPGESPMQFDGATVSLKALPTDLAQALSGAKKGDYRLHAGEHGQGHVIHVLEAVAPSAQPYADVRQTIQDQLFTDHLDASVKEWADKLRKAHPVKVYLTRIGS